MERSSGGGESLFFSHGTNIIVPPQEQRFLSTLTDAPSYTNTGRITIFAQNDFGADVFSTTIAGTYVPATVPEPTASWLGGLAALSLMRLRRR